MNTVLTDKEIEIIRNEFINDENIKSFKNELIKIYQMSIPIGINDNGFVYDYYTEKLISEIKKNMQEYISLHYGELVEPTPKQ